jgi:diaminohydroxyphosphoribosylaminopyrimidine deaminase / 5-amino-6-(5-phosphoribosylamino)uracil reductase
MNHQYEYYMQKVLKLAIKAKGQTSPNPMVGAIILNENGEFIADGYHLKA